MAAQNRGNQQKPKGMPRGKPFQKGQSGNPGGVPKLVLKVRKLLAENGADEAVTYLRRCVTGKETDVHVSMMGEVSDIPMGAKERITAAKVVLEFGTPKPKQEIEIDQTVNGAAPAKTYDVSKLSTEELIAYRKLREKALVDDGD